MNLSVMSTEQATPSISEVGYRRIILAFGAFSGAVPALSMLDITGSLSALVAPSQAHALDVFSQLSRSQETYAIGVVMTVLLAVLYELDSRKLDQVGEGVPLAWSYALIAPLSVVLVRQIPLLALLGILAGPPISALVYVFQRGRVGTVDPS